MEDNQKLISDDGCGSRLSENVSVHSEVTVVSPKSGILPLKKSFQEICEALSKCLNEDTLAVDAKWNLFIAACQSYRFDSCLKPFPPMFLTETREKDINLLLNVIDSIPSFSLLKKYISSPDKFQLSDNVVQLLYWLLIKIREPTLKTVKKEHFNEVLQLVPCELSAQKPDYIFKLKYSDKSASNVKWKNYKNNYKTLFAYHGSRLENFHSIIHYGLQLSFTKTSLFGEGVYLSSELLVSLPYSSTGFGWGKSLMGPELSVVALCEVLDHPSVYCQTKGSKKNDRCMAVDSIGGEVPHKYYVVSNSELVRIQYLLVYARSPPPSMQISGIRERSVFGWIKKHKLLSCIMGYIFLLASVGLSNNPQVVRYYKILLNKAGIK